MLIGVVGDIHGNTRALKHALDYFAARDVKIVMQVGDFGIFPMYNDTFDFLEAINEKLFENHQTLYVIRGNHDDPDFFDNNDVIRDTYGFGVYTEWSRIHFAPRAHVWEFGSRVFGQLGGAASIDRQRRQSGLDWWPDELIMKDDVEALGDRNLDYFFTHDASDYTPWGFDLIPQELSLLCRKYIDSALERTKPRWHFHGHYHRKYEWVREYWTSDNRTNVVGLDCDGTWYYYGILNTENDTFEWRTE